MFSLPPPDLHFWPGIVDTFLVVAHVTAPTAHPYHPTYGHASPTATSSTKHVNEPQFGPRLIGSPIWMCFRANRRVCVWRRQQKLAPSQRCGQTSRSIRPDPPLSRPNPAKVICVAKGASPKPFFSWASQRRSKTFSIAQGEQMAPRKACVCVFEAAGTCSNFGSEAKPFSKCHQNAFLHLTPTCSEE